MNLFFRLHENIFSPLLFSLGRYPDYFFLNKVGAKPRNIVVFFPCPGNLGREGILQLSLVVF